MKKHMYAEQQLREKIGLQKAGDLFPPENALAKELKVSVATIRHAMERLSREGLLVRSQGRRTTIGQDAERRLAGNGGRTVLLLSCDEGPFYHEELVEVQNLLFRNGFITSLCHLGGVALHEAGAAEALREVCRVHSDAVGMICGPIFGWYETVQAGLAEWSRPIVMLGSTRPIPANYAAVNVGAGAYEALRHLDQIGCKTIRFIGNLGHGFAWDRGSGIRQFVEEFSPDGGMEGFTIPALGTVESGYSAAAREFEAHRVPDGILAHNDLCAIGVLLAAKKCGVRIPEDVALAGFDGIARAAVVKPPLTTVEQPKLQVAAEAVRIMKELLSPGDVSLRHQVLLQPRLVLRESTMAYGGGGWRAAVAAESESSQR